MKVYLANFGISKLLSTAVSSKGTPGFHSLAEILDSKADVYSLGCVFLELFGECAIWKTNYIQGDSDKFLHLTQVTFYIAILKSCVTLVSQPMPPGLCS